MNIQINTSKVVSSAALFLAAVTGIAIAVVGADYRFVIVFVIAAAILGLLSLGERGIRAGFILFICSLGLGYRSLPITWWVKIVPAEIIIVGLFVWILTRPRSLKRHAIDLWLPTWLWLSIPFWIWAWRPVLYNTLTWDEKFVECVNFVLFLPLTWVANWVIRDAKIWLQACYTYYGVAVYIAIMGILEYQFPTFFKHLGVSKLAEGFIADGGFHRAYFSFWGTPDATFTCTLALPLSLIIWKTRTELQWRIATSVSIIVLIAAIYVGGFRSMWLMLSVISTLYFAVSRKYYMVVILVLAGLYGYSKLPDTAQQRVGTLLAILQAKPTDSSGQQRLHRFNFALDMAREHPEGMGWNAAQWCHNDFLSVAANQGILAALVLAWGWLNALAKLARRTQLGIRTRASHPYALPLFLAMVMVSAIMFLEGVNVLPQQSLMIWTPWILIEIWLRRNSTAKLTREFEERKP